METMRIVCDTPVFRVRFSDGAEILFHEGHGPEQPALLPRACRCCGRRTQWWFHARDAAGEFVEVAICADCIAIDRYVELLERAGPAVLKGEFST